MPQKKTDLDVIRRYLAIYALSKANGTTRPEAANCERQMAKMEASHIDLKRKAMSVLAVVNDADGGADGDRVKDRPIADGDAIWNAINGAWADSPMADASIPIHQRILMGLNIATETADRVGDFFSAPLNALQFQCSQAEPNARGELVVKVRVRPDDARRRAFREDVGAAVQKRLLTAVRAARAGRGRRGG